MSIDLLLRLPARDPSLRILSVIMLGTPISGAPGFQSARRGVAEQYKILQIRGKFPYLRGSIITYYLQ